jgi:hypothetical protein
MALSGFPLQEMISSLKTSILEVGLMAFEVSIFDMVVLAGFGGGAVAVVVNFFDVFSNFSNFDAEAFLLSFPITKHNDTAHVFHFVRRLDIVGRRNKLQMLVICYY